jgi:acyl-CoA thioester hydrolase
MKHTFKKRVRYGETDQMGFMYYGNYCLYYEIARAEMIRDFGYSYKELEDDGIQMPIVKVNSKFLRPALYDNLISIETEIQSLDKLPFITFLHKFFNEEKILIHKGEVTLVFVDSTTGKRCMPHEKMIQILKDGFKL